jgi:hypothetical protein
LNQTKQRAPPGRAGALELEDYRLYTVTPPERQG